MDALSNILLDACRHGTAEVIKFIVHNNPNLIIKKDIKNNTALHIACENGIMVEGIKCLYSAYPEALNLFNDEGASPIHMVCFHGKSVENLMFLLSKLPNGLDIDTANEKGDLPIHWISEDTSKELIMYLLEQCPKIAQMKNNEDGLPIHIACNKGLSLNVIRLLHNAYPAGISQQDKAGILPIHDALEFMPKLQLIKFFHEVSPESFHKPDNQGNLALHYAVCSSLEVVQFVTEANKLALQTTNKHGRLPIHRACHLSVNVNVIRFLHESYPKGIKTKTSKGMLPFHLATTNLTVSNYLYDLFNDAVKSPDKKGRYPIHIACQKGAPLDIIVFLIEKCPYAAREDDNSHMLPLHYALIDNAPLPTIKYLIEFFPSALLHADADHRLPFHLAFLYNTNLQVIHFLRTNYSKEFKELMVHSASQKVDTSTFILLHKSRQRELDLLNEIDRMKQIIEDTKQRPDEKMQTKKESFKGENSLFQDDEYEEMPTQNIRTSTNTIEELPENSTEEVINKTAIIITQEEKSVIKKNNYQYINIKSNHFFEQRKTELPQQRNTSKMFVRATVSSNPPSPAPQSEISDKEHNNSKEFRVSTSSSNGLSSYENNKNKRHCSELQTHVGVKKGDHQLKYIQNTHPRYHSSDSASSEIDKKTPSESDKKIASVTDKKIPTKPFFIEIDCNSDSSSISTDRACQAQSVATTARSSSQRSKTISRNVTTTNSRTFSRYSSFQTPPPFSADTAGHAQSAATAASSIKSLANTIPQKLSTVNNRKISMSFRQTPLPVPAPHRADLQTVITDPNDSTQSCFSLLSATNMAIETLTRKNNPKQRRARHCSMCGKKSCPGSNNRALCTLENIKFSIATTSNSSKLQNCREEDEDGLTFIEERNVITTTKKIEAARTPPSKETTTTTPIEETSKTQPSHPYANGTIVKVLPDTTPNNNRESGYARIESSSIKEETYNIKMLVVSNKKFKISWDDVLLTDELQDEFDTNSGIKKRRRRDTTTDIASVTDPNDSSQSCFSQLSAANMAVETLAQNNCPQQRRVRHCVMCGTQPCRGNSNRALCTLKKIKCSTPRSCVLCRDRSCPGAWRRHLCRLFGGDQTQENQNTKIPTTCDLCGVQSCPGKCSLNWCRLSGGDQTQVNQNTIRRVCTNCDIVECLGHSDHTKCLISYYT